MKIVADNTIPFLKGILEPVADITYVEAKGFTPQLVKGADALIVRSIDKCNSDLLEGSNVKLITTATIGYDHIDTAFCEQNGIEWRNAPGCNARSVGQYVLSSIALLSFVEDEEIKGKTIGIIGAGHVGKEVERLCRAFGMKVLLNDPPRAEVEGEKGFVSLDTIAEEADIITVHTPLTKEGKYPTYHLADMNFFKKFKRRPWFINAARGGIHNTEDLIRANAYGYISRLILDCWEKEPTINHDLLRMAYFATPHIAGFSADGKANATRMCLENISEFFGLDIPAIETIKPQPPRHQSIDATSIDALTSDLVTAALSTSFNPTMISRKLKANPDLFEELRNNYDNPREYEAYTITGKVKTADKKLLSELGFKIGS